jgi:hypothetical protein
MTRKRVGHDDKAWDLNPFENLPLKLMTLSELHPVLFPDTLDPKDHSSYSPELRSLLRKHFGKKFTPEQCVTKYKNMKKNVKTMDQCDIMTYLALYITYWDEASQKVRTTTCICDPKKVTPEQLMKFQLDVSFQPKSNDNTLLSLRGADVAKPASGSSFAFSSSSSSSGGPSGLLSAFKQLVMKKWTTNNRQQLDGKELELTNERVLFLPVGSIRPLNGRRNSTPNLGVVVLEAQADVNITIFPNDLGSMSWLVILYQAKKWREGKELKVQKWAVHFVQRGVVSGQFQWMKKSDC